MLFTEFDINRAKKVWQEEALETGERKGEKKAKIEIAQRLITMGLLIEQIAEASGLSVKEIEKLKVKNK